MPEDLCYLNFITYLVEFKFVGCIVLIFTHSTVPLIHSTVPLIYSTVPLIYSTVPLIYSTVPFSLILSTVPLI